MPRVSSLLICLIMCQACTSSGVSFDPKRAHHGNGEFISVKGGSFFDWLAMRWREGSPPQPDAAAIQSIVGEVDEALIASPATVPRATWVGHATVLVQYRDINYLTDPHLTQYPFYFDFAVKPRLTQPALRFEQLPAIDFIVISHNHYDHLDHRTVDMFGNSVTWFVPLGLKAWFLNRDIDADRVIEMDWWDEHEFNDQVRITFTPTQHWSKRTPWDTNESLWGSWAVDIDGFKSWFGGDTGYNRAMFREIGERAGPFRLAMIPIGAYAPGYFMSLAHLNPTEAVEVHKDIRATQSLPVHWGTFHLTHEPFLEPPELLKQALVTGEIPLTDFRPVKIGESLILD